MVKDTAPPHRYGPGFDPDPQFKQYHSLKDGSQVLGPGSYMNDRTTHSVGIRPHPKGNSIAKQLLNASAKPRYQKINPDDVVDLSNGAKFVVLPKEDNRPLIDKLHEATFTNPIGLQWIEDKYALRTLLRKAHCFTLDKITSAMVVDFSIAVAYDLDAVRQLAHPPFPVTWIEIDNRERVKRTGEKGIPLTKTARGESEAGEVVDKVGWLIWEAKDLGGWYMMYVTEVDQGVVVSPLAWWWHTGKPNPPPPPGENDEYLERLVFGVRNCGVQLTDAFVAPSSLHIDFQRKKLLSPRGKYNEDVRAQMYELAGELRHVFGFLMALGSGNHVDIKPGRAPDGPPRLAPNGKPLLPLEHRELTIHLGKRMTPEKACHRFVTRHKMRNHDVRGHLRHLSSGRIIPVKPHERGDKALGRVEKTYKVSR